MSKPKPILSEQRLEELITESKKLERSFSQWMRPRKVPNQPERSMHEPMRGSNGSIFEIRTHYWTKLACRFSIVLRFFDGPWDYRLVRFDGHAGPHTNKLEPRGDACRTVPRNTCHIHRITERYQRKALIIPQQFEEDGFASPRSEFADPSSAFEYFLTYCHVRYSGLEYISHNPLLD